MQEIQIIYRDGMLGFVDPTELNSLIEAGEILKFLRGESWAYPGIDPTRTNSSNSMAWGRRQTDPLYLMS